jgi:hypothetical protein
MHKDYSNYSKGAKEHCITGHKRIYTIIIDPVMLSCNVIIGYRRDFHNNVIIE